MVQIQTWKSSGDVEVRLLRMREIHRSGCGWLSGFCSVSNFETRCLWLERRAIRWKVDRVGV